MQLIAMGTGPFAVPSFHKLLESGHDVIAVVTRPIANSGRRSKQPPNPMRVEAESQSLPILDPPNVNAPEFVSRLKAMQPDLFFVCDYGQILSAECLATARLGGINLHGSLLPKYRGAAPVNWAIYRGETVTGVSVIHMTPRLDAGPTLASRSLEIGDDENAVALEQRLARLGVDAVMDAVDLLQKWDGKSAIGSVQDPSEATSARRLKKSDGRIDWTKPAKQIFDQIRAFQPWPGSHSFWQRESGSAMRLTIHRARVEAMHAQQPAPDQRPGTVTSTENQSISIATGAGELSIVELQPAGKRVMTAEEFLRGYAVKAGDQFADEQ